MDFAATLASLTEEERQKIAEVLERDLRMQQDEENRLV